MFLRRKYAADLPGLKALAEKVAGSSFKAVTITGNSFEGGSAQGVITFEPLEYLGACEEILLELDPDAPAPAGSTVEAVFHTRYVQA